jgi:hypothetical protein
MDLRDFPELDQWCFSHPTLARALVFEPRPSGVAIIGFPLRRLTVHSEIQQSLHDLLDSTRQKIMSVDSLLHGLIERPTATVEDFAFEAVEPLLCVRQQVFLLREMQHHFLSLYTDRHIELEREFAEQRELYLLFDGSAIPQSLLCRVNFAGLGWGRSEVMNSPVEVELRYLQKLATRIGSAVARFPRVVWKRSYDEFLVVMLKPQQVDPDVGYFPPLDLEQALARYFFSPTSEHRARIDADLMKITKEDGDTFTARIVRMCRGLIPPSLTGSAQDQSKCLLVLYRALFNRCYEIVPGFFAAHFTPIELLGKVGRLRELPANLREFCLPWQLLQPTDHTIPIRDLFISENSYGAAVEALSLASFEPNPIDQLHQIHRVFLVLQQTANAYAHPGVPQAHAELFSFDELFALFFGVLMAAECVDIFFVAWMINEFAPKSWLSPSFEYALANLDALVAHLQQIDVNALEASVTRGPPT